MEGGKVTKCGEFFAFYFSKPLKFLTPGKQSGKMTLPPLKNIPLTPLTSLNASEFAISRIVCHGNVNSIQNPSTVTNPTKELYCILLPLSLLCHKT